jgi:spore coat protein A, manganese oxidase
MPNRRDFLKGAALAGASFGLMNCGGGLRRTLPTTGGGGGSTAGVAEPFTQSPVLRKFIAPLPGLGSNGIPLASADTHVVPGADFYNLAAVEFEQLMHPDLPNPTRLWGYMDMATKKNAYLGPIIVGQRGRPVVMNMQNRLPARHILPVDSSLMGAEMAQAQNRIAVHLHGGFVPWTMDGNPYSWFTPEAKAGGKPGTAGECFINVATNQAGTAQYYYPNNQSARLMWYHDHALGITRLNAYAGLASGYLLIDPVMTQLTSGNAPVVPPLNYTIPLIIQDKSFKLKADAWGRAGDLWYPSKYESTELPTGRWDLGVPADGFTPEGKPDEPSCVPEFFADTPVINGAAYPYLEVEPRRYRFLLLNGSQARFYNLNLFYESQTDPKEADLDKPGPAFIQIGNECGLLPAPAVLNDPPVLMPYDSDYAVDPQGPKNLLLAPAERADLIIDFSECEPGDLLILYNDAPAPFPGGEPRNDYFTNDPDETPLNGAPSTALGKGPNMRTLMQIRVVARTGAEDPYEFDSTYNALVDQLPQAYAESHIPYGETDLNPEGPGITYKNKTLNEDFDEYGRLIQRVGNDQKLYKDSYARNYQDTPTEVVNKGETQVWDIYNTTGDTHPMHFHLVNVQVIGRADFDASNPSQITFTPQSAFRAPDDNERGWKETVRMNPGTVTRVIMKFDLPAVPFYVQNSPRLAQYGLNGAEYVWHCHILEHEEHDMMRPLIVKG